MAKPVVKLVIKKRAKSKPKVSKVFLKKKKSASLLSSFEYFDPIKTDLLEIHLIQFYGIARRARQILKERDRKYIDATLRKLDWMLAGSREKSIEKMIESYKEPIEFSYTTLLQEKMASNKARGKKNISDTTRAEYFAILALALIGQAFHWYRYSPHGIDPVPLTDGTDTSESQLRFMQELATDAMEAIGVAESLIAQQKLTEEESAERVRISKIGTDAQHTETRIAKCEFVGFVLSTGSSNKSEAARLFYRRFLQKEKIYKNEECAVRTLTAGFRDWKKGKLKCENIDLKEVVKK